MAGRHSIIIPIRSKSRIILYSTSFIALSFLLILFLFSSSSPSPSPRFQFNSLNSAETSFVTSLEHFLTLKSPHRHDNNDDDTIIASVDGDVSKLDTAVYRTEMERLYAEDNYPLSLPIRVYVYNMPNKFTYDLLWLFRNTYKDTSNLTSNGTPVHRLIEQLSIDYWLWSDLIAPQSQRLLKIVVRVHRQHEADLFYIPFFTSPPSLVLAAAVARVRVRCRRLSCSCLLLHRAPLSGLLSFTAILNFLAHS